MNIYTKTALQALYQRRWLIIGVTVMGLFIGLLMNQFIWIPGFQAEVELVIQAPALGEAEPSTFLPEIFHARAYIELLESDTIMGMTRQQLIQTNFWPDEDDIPSIDDFADRLSVEAVVLDQTTRPVTYAPFLTLRATGQSEERARMTADTWADVGVAMGRRAFALSSTEALATIDQQLAGTETELESVWQQLQEVEQEEGNTFTLEEELLSLIDQIDEVQYQITQMRGLQAGQAERYAQAQEQLQDEPRKIELFSAPSDDVYWLLQDGKENEKPANEDEAAESLRQRGFLNEVVNESYVALQQEAALARMSEAEAKAALQALQTRLEELQMEKQKLQQSLGTLLRSERELTAKAEAMQEVYIELASVYAFANLAAGLREGGPETQALPTGLNRLSDEVYVREVNELFGTQTRILLLTLLAFLLAVALVVAEALTPLFGRPR